MAVILYPSGVTELYEPQLHTFSDEDILKMFNDYEHIRTARLYEIVNTWCVWGVNKKEDELNYNKLGSDILQENVFCHVLFIHDTEINPAWMLTDTIIYKGYDHFKTELLQFFDEVAESVIRESQEQRTEGGNQNLLFLNTVGPTEDKRVLFEFETDKQSQEFYDDKNFFHFAIKIREYLAEHYIDADKFYIYQDKKSIIFVKNENVEALINSLIGFFERTEKYEYCSEIKAIYQRWIAFNSGEAPPKKKRTPKKK